MKTITILMDSLNRHRLECYGGNIKTPNIDRIVKRGVTFDKAYSASLPCMPARRDLMTGRYCFLESGWGPIEPWDETCIDKLKDNGVFTHMITDHYHYFHSGGENYHNLFNTWEFERGQEADSWKANAGEANIPENPVTVGRSLDSKPYWDNRERLDLEDDMSYPTTRCFLNAAEFVDFNAKFDNWHLHLEVFDPHEPFDCPSKWLKKAGDTYDRNKLYSWPSYAPLGTDGDDEIDQKHIEMRYAASLMMADHYLGKLLDKIDETNSWDDTCIILTTDHGHMLGEHGLWAKNYMYDYEEVTHIPMIIAHPQAKAGTRTSALVSAVDMAPTLCDLHGAEKFVHAHGKSYVDVVLGKTETHHDTVLTGYFGKDISISDGEFTYTRQSIRGSRTYHHTLIPKNFRNFYSRDALASSEYGDWLPSADGMKMLRIPMESIVHHDAPDYNLLYNLQEDPHQNNPIRDDALEDEWAGKLRSKLEEVDARDWQFERMNLV